MENIRDSYIYFKKMTGDYRCLCLACNGAELTDNEIKSARLKMLSDTLAERDRLKQVEEKKEEEKERQKLSINNTERRLPLETFPGNTPGSAILYVANQTAAASVKKAIMDSNGLLTELPTNSNVRLSCQGQWSAICAMQDLAGVEVIFEPDFEIPMT